MRAKGKRSLESIEANNVCELLWYQSSGGRHGTSSAIAFGVTCCCILSLESLLRARVLTYSFPPQAKPCGSHQRWPVSADFSQVCSQGAFATLDITTLSVLEAQMFYHNEAIVVIAIRSKALKCFRSCSTGVSIANAVRKISKAWTAPAKNASNFPLENIVSSDSLLVWERKQVFVLCKNKQKLHLVTNHTIYYTERAQSTTKLM